MEEINFFFRLTKQFDQFGEHSFTVNGSREFAQPTGFAFERSGAFAEDDPAGFRLRLQRGGDIHIRLAAEFLNLCRQVSHSLG